MVDFRVQEQGLRDFATQLEVLEAASRRAVAYTDHTNMSAQSMSGSVLQRVVEPCHAVQPTLSSVFERLYDLSGRGADEIRRSATYYEKATDQAAAEYERQQMAPQPIRQGGPR